MELLKTDNSITLEHKSNKETFSSIIDEIFIICKNDKKNFNHEKLNEIEYRINELKGKITKQENLLIEAKKIEDNLDNNIFEVNEYNRKTKVKLLETLGSDL